ncbi:acyltransferase family protein [Psychrobacillus sp. FSL H8-0487]|uniref:acyltransferase family protein n=1 Tax=Psychrobacillus sp. FSL H8-0487 TaxID=2921391 RepID=UPI0030F550A4
MIKEWNLLRAVTCLCIVFLHSTTQTASIVSYPEIEYYQFFRILLCFATPTFIVLSVIILANRYPEKLPSNFWESRFKFIFLPFLSFALIDALVVSYSTNTGTYFAVKLLKNIMTGSFEGWFILVIFQFYFLHFLVTKYKVSMAWLVPTSILIMLWYLNWMENNPDIFLDFNYILKLPFLAWVGYFALGYIIGKNYTVISQKLFKHRWATLLYIGVSFSLVFLSYEAGNTLVYSRRFDLFPFVLSVTCALIAWGQAIPNFKVVKMLNDNAFGIFLVHWQVQVFLAPITANYFQHTSTRVVALFIFSLLVSLIVIKLISLLPFGEYIIGKTKKKAQNDIKLEPITT